MNIKAVTINQKFGYFTFTYTLNNIPYVFSLKMCSEDGSGTLKNVRTKQVSIVVLNNDVIDTLLLIVDEYLEHQKKIIDSQLNDSDYFSVKALKKDINQQKKHYYNIIKSNKNTAFHHRPKD